MDRARAARDQDRQRVSKIEADLKTAQLGSRSDQVAAAAAVVEAQEAALARADWDLAQKRQAAPVSGVVFDTMYQTGEWVPAGRPVVALLPPQNVKVRAFVPEARLSTLRYGETLRVIVDGVAKPYTGKVSFLSPRAEFTPPVIYSLEEGQKLVYKIEARPLDPDSLRVGQPVTMHLP